MTPRPAGAIAVAIALALLWGEQQASLGWTWLLGCAIGALLMSGGIGFSGPIRRWLRHGEVEALAPLAGLLALLILGSALLFALAESLGLGLRPTQAPIRLSLVVGAFLFGIGMQLARRCASGTLASAAHPDREFFATLLALTAGVFLGSLHRPFWERVIPGALPPVLLLERLPLPLAVLAQLALLALCIASALALPRVRRRSRPSSFRAEGARGAVHPPSAVVALALLLLLLFGVSGEPWKVLWGLGLTAAHGAKSVGWDPKGSAFWASPSRLALLSGPEQWLRHGAVVVNLGVIYGAWIAGLWPKRQTQAAAPPMEPAPGLWWRQLTGGLLMGYGGFLSYGCNISSFLGGVMSFSLHGWVWLGAAVAGSAFWLHWEKTSERNTLSQGVLSGSDQA
jgi:uncharacterized membrane protein YedE/YeeE